MISSSENLIAKMKSRFMSLLFKSIKTMPVVKKKIQKEYNEIMRGLEDQVKPYRNRPFTFPRLPETGRSKKEIITEMEGLREIEESRWKDGFVSGAVYHGDDEHLRFLNEVYAINSQSNPLHSDIWLSTVKYESEVVSMTANMLSAQELTGRYADA